ncbi:MAG: enoyl-CoA hydratase/isomerase family protein [Candidatus Riflebacteria bacterium]|nr:enoyl-CoA hydratase/isomerase family protein [Candidatus Riflebacteria bacterium]
MNGRTYERIRVTQDEGVVTLELNRPEVRNAIDLQMARDIDLALEEIVAQNEPCVLVVTGVGKRSFASGADMNQVMEEGREDALRAINSTLFYKLEDFPWPTIGAIEGIALGCGCELAMTLDLRIAGASSRLGQPEVGLGVIPGAGATWRLARLVGLGRAKELILTGDTITAVEAERIGLVNRVVPDGHALEEAQSLGWHILRQDPLSVRVSKMILNAWNRDFCSPVMEKLGQAVLFEAEGKRHRVTAFLERKKGS